MSDHTHHCSPAAQRTVTSAGTHQPSLREAGFTLVELMVTLGIAAILLGLAIPAFRTFVQNDRQWTQATNLVMSLNAARSEAIKQDTAVSVCPSTDGKSCMATPWAQGWIVLSSAPNATPIQTVPALAAGTTLSEANNVPQVTYNSNGTVSASAAFTTCDERGAGSARYAQVAAGGRVTSSTGQKPDGTALTCP